eukprot:4173909-Prymnesium_polylepis.1
MAHARTLRALTRYRAPRNRPPNAAHMNRDAWWWREGSARPFIAAPAAHRIGALCSAALTLTFTRHP